MTNSPSQRRVPSTALIAANNLSPFGNKLVRSGYVNVDQMQQALVESRKSGRPLTQVLEALTGQQLPPDLVRQYKKQQLFELKILYGVDSLDPEISEIANDQVTELIDTLIPIDICRRYSLVPLSKSNNQPPSVLIAMVDPDNLAAQDDLNRVLRPQGFTMQRMVITQEDFQQIISKYLDEQVKRQPAPNKINPESLEIDIAQIETTLEDAEDDEPSQEDLSKAINEADSAPIIKTVNQILAKALTEGVSDIHIEPQEEDMRVRMRKDGVLQEYYRLPKKIIPALTSRFKIISNLDIAERRQAQDGRIRRVFQGRTVDFRVNSLPSRYGEKIVLRILDNASTQLGLDKLITDPETLKLVREMASRPFGLILVTGPTGSGKSTTLYSILAERNEPGVNISTAEDPIEYALPGITQCQVIREKDLTFANILRAFLRQDPDIILVGETRDKETAKTAIEAALTGHLVLTTLHTNDASGAIARLDEMGVEPFMVSGALLGVVAQRLMRRVCSECRLAYQPEPEELARYGLSASKEAHITFYKANTIPLEARAELKDKGELCPKCGGVGYKGRCGVYEVLRVTEPLQMLINQGAPTERIKETAVEEGMVTLLAYSLNLVRRGDTTLEEVERVTYTDTGLEAELKAKRKVGLTCKTCGAGLQQEWLECPYCMTPRFTE
ncbi:GspE/PulE family protein [Kamptonema cortianum]|uniref:GspE/PulE family protein n=1 Tax=Geitlerinema calcuttense NRMC-F 0142 TaxID=2922238 RepID=A0ABT7LXI6_9CYAN|nr:GspE/PulE family protein [Geitlerinema calcuttense]MDI9640370.1 GspE/PulE family protein [Geitlerinema splendidum]MDK3155579.1 GspE/PulE family protein [Kamptonema cortianum]MDL5044750.1 GspE/PulE family protein [Oscillatoria amoena NRMC-F 0135]MDL5056725.1 GspE/PulE family protein [Geitlerinema calcuttense NRMC-F 0142]